MRGYNADRTGYFAQTERGLWIRSEWCRDTGFLKLGWQVRYRRSAMMLVHLDENGSEFRSEPIAQAKYSESPWVDAEPFLSLDRVEVMAMGRGDVNGFIEGLMRHEVELLAMGLGETSAEVAGWFKEPELGMFVRVGMKYAISAGDGAFSGLDGMSLIVESLEGGLVGVIRVDGDLERYPFEHDFTPEFVAQLVRSTTPVD